VYASPEDIAAFINSNMSDSKFMGLFNSLVLLDWKSIDSEVPWVVNDTSLVPGAWSVMKLTYSPYRHKDKFIPVDSAIHRLAMSGELNRAVEKASRRLLGSGYPTVLNSAGGSASVSRRMAAALLFPLSRRTTGKLFQTATNSEENNERK
jgi:CRISPR-associated protein Csx17